MIFQHTLNDVLSGEKTQTSRIWKHYYRVQNSHMRFVDRHEKFGKREFYVLWSVNKSLRRLYEVGRTYAVQAKRGGKGLARIRILKLAKRDIREFDESDIQREGFDSFDSFYMLWQEMHDRNYEALVINFELVQ